MLPSHAKQRWRGKEKAFVKLNRNVRRRVKEIKKFHEMTFLEVDLLSIALLTAARVTNAIKLIS